MRVLRASLKNLSPSCAPVKTTFAMQGSESHGMVLAFKANMQHSNNEVVGRGGQQCLDFKRLAHSCTAKTTIHVKSHGAFAGLSKLKGDSRILIQSLLIKAFLLAAIQLSGYRDPSFKRAGFLIKSLLSLRVEFFLLRKKNKKSSQHKVFQGFDSQLEAFQFGGYMFFPCQRGFPQPRDMKGHRRRMDRWIY